MSNMIRLRAIVPVREQVTAKGAMGKQHEAGDEFTIDRDAADNRVALWLASGACVEVKGGAATAKPAKADSAPAARSPGESDAGKKGEVKSGGGSKTSGAGS